MGLSLLEPTLLLLLMISFICAWVWLVKRCVSPKKSSNKKPINIAKKRYVAGEITREEFEIIKRDISA